MRFLSVCSGIGAPEYAWSALGWECVGVSEIEAFPNAVLSHRFPGVRNFGDFTKIQAEDVGGIGAVDLLVGGTPCFGAGTPIVTERGIVPIEEVRVGDLALTHKGRFRPVLAVGWKYAETVLLRAQGSSGVVTTADHRFLCATRTGRGTRKNGKPIRITTLGKNRWVAAHDAKGAFAASLCAFPASVRPPIIAVGNESNFAVKDEAALLWFCGAWLGDGWARINRRRGCALVCARKGPQAEEVLARASRIAGRVSRSHNRTADRIQVSSRPLARWLMQHFGSGAFGKTVPTWLLGLDAGLRQAFLDGYLFADGCKQSNGHRATTISPRIAAGVRMLAESLGKSVSIHLDERPPTCTLEGRTVNQRDTYSISIYNRSRSSWARGRYRFGLVRSAFPTGRFEPVYDLTVEGDHSYVADGFCVHNCQDFSVAGLRAGLAGDRGRLTIEFCHLAGRLRPRWLVWENVPGVLSADGGNAFSIFLDTLWELGYGTAYRVLDAQYAGVPQRRRRVFVVGYLGDWRRAAAVLFERHSLSGDPPPRRKTRQTTPSLTSSGAGVSRVKGAARSAHAEWVESVVNASAEIAPTLQAHVAKQWSDTPMVAHPLSAAPYGDRGAGDETHLVASRVSPTLRAGGNETGGDRPPGTDVDTADSLIVVNDGVAATLGAEMERNRGLGNENEIDLVAVAFKPSHYTRDKDGCPSDVVPPLSADADKGDQDTVLAIRNGGRDADMRPGRAGTTTSEDGTMFTLQAEQHHAVAFQARHYTRGGKAGGVPSDTVQTLHADGKQGDGEPLIAFSCKDSDEDAAVDVSPTMRAINNVDSSANGGSTIAVAFNMRGREEGNVPEVDAEGLANIRSSSGGSTNTHVVRTVEHLNAHVRRLTPRECERLQGFPDDYTLVPYRGKPAADGPRYRALGNSMAVPVVRWIGQRIDFVESITCGTSASP